MLIYFMIFIYLVILIYPNFLGHCRQNHKGSESRAGFYQATLKCCVTYCNMMHNMVGFFHCSGDGTFIEHS